MSQRSDTVRSITLIVGSAFAAVCLTTFVIMAKEKPAEQPTPPTEVTTVVVEPMSVSGFVVGRVEPRELVVSGTKATGPIVFVDGVRMERTDYESLLRDVNPSCKVNIQPIGDAPREAGSRSGGKKPDGKNR